MDLQARGEEILEKLFLPQGLEKIGEAYLVGNLALKTTVKPDIDIQIYSKPFSWEDNSRKIVEYFKKFGLTDYVCRKLKESNKDLTSFKYVFEDTTWNIDITQTTPSDNYLQDAYRFYLKYIKLFTPQKTKTIRDLKTDFYKINMLHHSLSYYIYLAVLENKAKDKNDILRYLKDHNIDLKRFK